MIIKESTQRATATMIPKAALTFPCSCQNGSIKEGSPGSCKRAKGGFEFEDFREQEEIERRAGAT